MQIMIECEYCGSMYDFTENHTCPNCAAIPNKKIVAAAKAAAKSEKHQSSESSILKSSKSKKKPSSLFMTIIVKLIPLWIFLSFAMFYAVGTAEDNTSEVIVSQLKTVDELTFEEHSLNEEFWYEDKIKLTIDEAFYSDNDVVNTLLPDDKKMLVVHISGTIDEMDDDYFSYSRFSIIKPYITNSEYCRERLNYTALDTINEVYASNIFSFTNFSKYSTTRDGYWCFIVDAEDTEISLCLNDISVENNVLDIDLVHKVIIPLT